MLRSITTELQFEDNSGASQSIFDGTYANNVAGGGIPIEFEANITCSEADGYVTGQLASGEWLMSTKLWVKHNFFGTHVGSYTHSWKKKNNGTWQRKRAKIHTAVDGTFRNDDCYIVEQKTGSKTHNNDRKIQKTKSKVFQKHRKLYQYDVKSGHTLEKNGVFLSLNMTLEDC